MPRAVPKLPLKTPKPRRSKYRVDLSPEGKEKRTYNGRCYDSLFERQYAELLQMRLRAGEFRGVEEQVTFPLRSQSGAIVARYRADFVVTNNDGSRHIIECKGRPTLTWPRTLKHMAADYPDVPITVVYAPKRERRRRK